MDTGTDDGSQSELRSNLGVYSQPSGGFSEVERAGGVGMVRGSSGQREVLDDAAAGFRVVSFCDPGQGRGWGDHAGIRHGLQRSQNPGFAAVHRSNINRAEHIPGCGDDGDLSRTGHDPGPAGGHSGEFLLGCIG